jgi:hypothetical protein
MTVGCCPYNLRLPRYFLFLDSSTIKTADDDEHGATL